MPTINWDQLFENIGQMSIMKIIITLACLVPIFISVLLGSFLFYETITVGPSFLSIIILPTFIIVTLVAVFIPTGIKINYIHRRLTSFVIWLGLLSISLFIISISNKINNLSPILFRTDFYYDDGIRIYFRKNNTFRAVNSGLAGGYVSYGDYELKDSIIILKDKIRFGNAKMKDTLIVTNNGVSFSLEESWRQITQDTMWLIHGNKAKFQIYNNTNYTINDITIKMDYTKEKINPISIASQQSEEYNFNLQNPHVDGGYILTFNINKIDTNKILVKKFTNNYPLETVTAMYLYEDFLVTELIFGNKITTKF